MTLRDYQEQAVSWLSTKRYALIVAPAGSGKTLIAAAALDRVLNKRHRLNYPRIGWICNTIEQKDQAHTALDRYGIEATVECAAGSPDMTEMHVLIVDEAHHSPSPTWSGIISGCKGAVWMFTATPWKEDDEIHNQIMRQFCDENIFQITREDVARNLAEARVVMLTDTDDSGAEIQAVIEAELQKKRYMLKFVSEGELFGRVAFQVCMNIGIVGNQRRNQAIIRSAKYHHADSTLILIHKIEHGEGIAAEIDGAILCHSKMGKKKRLQAIQGFAQGVIPCIVATSLADEGLDVPRANVLIMGGAGKSRKAAEQRTGRVLRTFHDKTHGMIYDFTDTHHALLRNQSLKRLDLYRSLGYRIVTGNRNIF